MTDFQHTWFNPHGSHRKMLPRTLETPNPWCQLKTPFCSPKGNQCWLRHLIKGVNWTILLQDRKKGVRINSKSWERQVHAPRLEPTAPICLADRNHAHYPSRHCTILKRRRLNDGLSTHVIWSTRESSDDVTRTIDTHPSKVHSDNFPHSPKGNQSDGLELLPPRSSNKMYKNWRKKGVRTDWSWQIPEGQEHQVIFWRMVRWRDG